MPRPLRIYNTSDLREMTDEEIKSKIVPLILQTWATTDTYNRGDVKIETSSPNIGTIYDRERHGGGDNVQGNTFSDSVGAHPVPGTYDNHNRGGLSQNKDVLPSYSVEPFLHSENSSNLKDIDEAGLQSDILRCCKEVWSATGTSTGVGSYALQPNDPSGAFGGTWVQQSGSFAEDDDDGGRTWYLWRKTHGVYSGATNGTQQSATQYVPVKTKGTGGDIIQMTDANILTWVNAWRTYITDGTGGTGVGTYILKLGGAPSTGSWTNMGVYEDILRDTGNVTYQGTYCGTYYKPVYYGTRFSHNQGYPGCYSDHYYPGLTILSTYSSNYYNLFRRIS